MTASTVDSDADLDRLLLPSEGPIELPESLQRKIVTRLWHYQSPLAASRFQLQRYIAYFDYFKCECYNWRVSGKPVAIETYRDFLDLVDHLRVNHMEPRSSPRVLEFFPPSTQVSLQSRPSQQTIDFLQPLATRYQSCSADSASNAIDLTIRLWLMIAVGSLGAIMSPATSSVEWSRRKSLDDFISATFDPNQPSKEQKLERWPKTLNVYGLARIGGFTIHWTSNLADHLLFDDDLGYIYLYHHASILEGHRNESEAGHILPAELIDKTLHSLALMLPTVNRKCRKWFNKEKRIRDSHFGPLDPQVADQKLGRQGRSVENYRYWNDRLLRVAQAFDRSEPRGMSSWWIDRRNRVQWYTFWIAALVLVLTIIFGLIQSITGILQAYAAYHPLGSH
ncbi:MAG: hypothetical protein M1816_000468 [Peltula sp. TS41687]|nr:MAG: hypothetical protein M1816_000468 [Peltula sp. TS41687]